MSSTFTSPSPMPLAQLPPAIQAQLDAATNLLILGSVFPALLVPIVIALFFFSDSSLRKKPIFILNVLAVLLGLGYGGVGLYNLSRTVSGREVKPVITTALTCLYFFVPLCVQSILLVRIVAVYPPRTLSWTARIFIYGTFISLSIGRLVNISLAFSKIEEGAREFPDAWKTATIAWNIPNSKVEWFLQLFYDVFASTLFLLRLKEGGALKRKEAVTNNIITNAERWSYTSRLRALFWIAVSNFVLPVIFNVAQIILIFRDSDFVDGAYVLIVNTYVEIISVLLATLWCSSAYWQTSSSFVRENAVSLEHGLGRGGTESGETLDEVKFAAPSQLVSRVLPDTESSELTT